MQEKTGQKILYDLRSSRVVKETVERYGGIALMCRVGHSLIKEDMRKENARFAGELSGHYYLQDCFYIEVPFFIVLKVLELMGRY